MKERLIEIGRDSAWYLASNAVVAVIGFIAIPILTRIFPPRQYGIFSLVNTAIALGSPILYAWLATSIIRFYPEHEDREELDVFYSTVLSLTPYYLVLFLGIMLPVAAFLLPLGKYRVLVCLGIAVFALWVIFNIAQALMRARQQAWEYAALSVFVAFCRYLVGASIAVWLGQGVKGPFWGWLGALIIAIPIELIVIKTGKYYKWKKSSRTLQRAFFSFGFILIFVTFLSEVLSAVDRYMLQGFKGSYQVGLYSMVYTLVTNSLGVISSFVALAAAPVIMQVYEREGEERTRALIGKITRYTLMLLVPATVGIVVLRDPITRVATSAKYIPAEPAYLPIAVGITFFYISWIPANAFLVKKRTKLTMIPMAIATVANVVINIFLIPKYGFNGAAWATFISYFVYMLVLIVMSIRLMSWDFPWLSSLRICLATGAMTAALYGMMGAGLHGFIGLLVMVVGGTLLYFLVLTIIGEYSKSEFGFALDLAQRVPAVGRAIKHARKSHGERKGDV